MAPVSCGRCDSTTSRRQNAFNGSGSHPPHLLSSLRNQKLPVCSRPKAVVQVPANLQAARSGRFLSPVWRPQISHGGATDSRRLRHRLPARAADLRAAKLQRHRRYRLARDDRHDRRRLVACDGSAQELQRATTDRSAAFLRPDARADQLPALTAEGGKNNRSQGFRTG